MANFNSRVRQKRRPVPARRVSENFRGVAKKRCGIATVDLLHSPSCHDRVIDCSKKREQVLPHQPPARDAHRLANTRGVTLRAGRELLQRRFAGEHVEQAVVVDAVLALARHLLLMVDREHRVHAREGRSVAGRIGPELLLLFRTGKPIRPTEVNNAKLRITRRPLPGVPHGHRAIAVETERRRARRQLSRIRNASRRCGSRRRCTMRRGAAANGGAAGVYGALSCGIGSATPIGVVGAGENGGATGGAVGVVAPMYGLLT